MLCYLPSVRSCKIGRVLTKCKRDPWLIFTVTKVIQSASLVLLKKHMNFFSCFRKRFEALKVLENVKSIYFCVQNTRNLPSNLPRRLGPSLIAGKVIRDVTLYSWPYLMLHWGTQCDVTFRYRVRFWPRDDRDKFKGKLRVSWKQK